MSIKLKASKFKWKYQDALDNYNSITECHLTINGDIFNWITKTIFYHHILNKHRKSINQYNLHSKEIIHEKTGTIQDFIESSNLINFLYIKNNDPSIDINVKLICRGLSNLIFLQLGDRIMDDIDLNILKNIKLFKTANNNINYMTESQVLLADDIPDKFKSILPSKYEFVCYDNIPSGLIGISSNSIIHLVQRKSDKSLWAAKFNKNGKGIDQDDNIDDYNVFKKLFNNPIDIRLYPNVCLKTYIRGHEIAYYMITLDFFYHKDAHKLQSLYKKFHENMWDNKIYVNDGNPTNIMVSNDLTKIGIIDSRGYHKYSNKIDAYTKGLNELYRWIVSDWLQCTCDPAVKDLITNHKLMAYAKYKTLTFFDSWKKDLETQLSKKAR